MSVPLDPEQILQAHQLYCQLTGQNLRLDYLRQRQWYDLLVQGFTLQQVRRVIRYLQREVREGRRNVGALKLSNLLQPDRFEEDLHIRRIRLHPPPTPPPQPKPSHSLSPEERDRRSRHALDQLRQLKQSLR
jgi:broad specificity phosphatase PhoE